MTVSLRTSRTAIAITLRNGVVRKDRSHASVCSLSLSVVVVHQINNALLIFEPPISSSVGNCISNSYSNHHNITA